MPKDEGFVTNLKDEGTFVKKCRIQKSVQS